MSKPSALAVAWELAPSMNSASFVPSLGICFAPGNSMLLWRDRPCSCCSPLCPQPTASSRLALVENFPRRHGRACVLVTEGDVAMNEVANRMDPRPARRCLLKQLPCDVGKPVGLAVAAAKQID